jgi:hypothetical protein
MADAPESSCNVKNGSVCSVSTVYYISSEEGSSGDDSCKDKVIKPILLLLTAQVLLHVV